MLVFSPLIGIANELIVEHGRLLFYDLKKKGLYYCSQNFASVNPIEMGVVRGDLVGSLDQFHETLEKIGFGMQ